MSPHHDTHHADFVSSQTQRRRYGILAVLLLVLLGVAGSLFVPVSGFSRLTTEEYVLVALFGLIAGIFRTLEKKLGKSVHSSRLTWFDFGSALVLIAALYSHPLIVLILMSATEAFGRLWLGKDDNRLEASIANTASEFLAITTTVCLLQALTSGTAHFSVFQPTFFTVAFFGFAALLHELVASVLNPLMFNIIDGRVAGQKISRVFTEEKQRRAVLCLGYVLLTMCVSSVYLFSNVAITVACATLAVGLAFLLRLWDSATQKAKAHEHRVQTLEHQLKHTQELSAQLEQPVTPHHEPISWSLASMAFKILHTNQGRFVRHSVATARLCEHVALELQSQGRDDVDPDEAWVVGLLHDVALMDKPTQVLRFAERVERLVDLEEYRDRKGGGKVHLNVVDHGLPEVTLEDTDALDTHPEVGAKLLAGWPRVSEAVALHHTVCFEYDQLPLLTQILVVCDKYEMLASRDGYYTQVSLDEAVNAVFEECMGVKETPQVINALKMVLATRDGAFWDASDIDYDQEVQMIASRLQAYAATQRPQQQVGPGTAESQVMVGVQHEQPPLFHPLASRIHAKHTPHKENSSA